MVVGKKSASVYNISVDEESSGDRKSLTGVNPRSAQAKSNFQKYNLYKQTKIYLWLQKYIYGYKAHSDVWMWFVDIK